MNLFIQNALAATTLIIAVGFLVKKFIWKPKKKNSKTCGSDGCGCH